MQEYLWKSLYLLSQKTLLEGNCWFDQRGEFAIMPQIILMWALNHYSSLQYIFICYYLASSCLAFRKVNGISIQKTQ